MTFLYNLLGISAFAGVAVIIIATPLNNYLSKREWGIRKSLLAARDERMGVLNEILTAIKFIKFFAWEGRWIERTEQARNTELGWLIKGVFVQYMRVDSVLTSMPVRLNRIMLGVLWALLPMLVPICSFFSFV